MLRTREPQSPPKQQRGEGLHRVILTGGRAGAAARLARPQLGLGAWPEEALRGDGDSG